MWIPERQPAQSYTSGKPVPDCLRTRPENAPRTVKTGVPSASKDGTRRLGQAFFQEKKLQEWRRTMSHQNISGNTWLAAAFAAACSFAAAGASAETAEDDAGQVAFNTHCRNCHSVKPDDHRLGPSLHNIFGAPAGQAKDFPNYSGSLTPDITWDEATLDKFIADPKSIASNTTMTPFAGIQDTEQRKLIIDYLKSQSKDS
jgi:cytochrome c